MVPGLGMRKPSPGGPAGPTKVSASTISHGPCSLFEMDRYTCSTVFQPTNPSIRPSIHPCIHPSIHPSVHPSIHPSICPSIHPSIHPSIYPCIHRPSSVTPCSLALPSASLWNTHTRLSCVLHAPFSVHPSITYPPAIHPPFCALTHSPITCQSTRPPLYLPTLSSTYPLTHPLTNPPSDYPGVGQSAYPSTYPSGHPSIHHLFSHRTKLSKP